MSQIKRWAVATGNVVHLTLSPLAPLERAWGWIALILLVIVFLSGIGAAIWASLNPPTDDPAWTPPLSVNELWLSVIGLAAILLLVASVRLQKKLNDIESPEIKEAIVETLEMQMGWLSTLKNVPSAWPNAQELEVSESLVKSIDEQIIRNLKSLRPAFANRYQRRRDKPKFDLTKVATGTSQEDLMLLMKIDYFKHDVSTRILNLAEIREVYYAPSQ